MYLLSGVRMDSAIILDVSVKDLIGSVPSPAQKPSIIPHFKFRLLCEAFRGLAPTHLRLPLVQPYTDLTELSTRFLYHVPFLTLQCRRACRPLPRPPWSLLKTPPAFCETFLALSARPAPPAHERPLHRNPYFIICCSAYIYVSASCTSHLVTWVEDDSIYPPTLPWPHEWPIVSTQ